jgi:hypothetical protein
VVKVRPYDKCSGVFNGKIYGGKLVILGIPLESL